ncbi:DNA-binding transcriptional regulator, MerR family [Quadrisphaera granulorum]|uniref:DNA-binding transcriptional MerR regulator n=1 Tax=Quadrisphaera granulorum TaxID=317664 RepID=A0A316AC55_9ACTN|nr:MerR family transcriptional regulator [Quadrisphaera granulorum]PWJ54620.1 DNA-binding transcriptional MerR regulator [Quadrisphaera granulorum]SZE95982.1 DNA-binding transcriptional regulator, MerR family [Quadrisphaera granulorum]
MPPRPHSNDDPDKPMQIGQVIELTGLSVNTLRHWDEVGLLSPSARSEGGFRLYSRHDVDRLLVIRRMKPLGFTLDQMRDVMAIADTVDAESFGGADSDPAEAADLAARLADYLDQAEESRRKLIAKVAMAEEFVGLLRERHARATSAAGDASTP